MLRLFAAALLAVLLAAGCASSSSKTFRDDGVSVRYPSDWHATRRALTPVTSPVQVLAVASYRLPARKGGRRRVFAQGSARPAAAERRLPLRLGVRPARAGRRPERRLPAAARPLRIEGANGFRVPRPELRRRLSRGGPAVPDPCRPRPAGRGGRARDGSEGAGQSRSFEPRLTRTHAYAGCDLAAEWARRE